MTNVDGTARWANPNRTPPTTCTVEGCGGKHVARGLCRMHYTRYNRGKPIGSSERQRNPGALCGVNGCGRSARMWGYCTMHGQRYRTHGDPEVLGWSGRSDDVETSLYRVWGDGGELLYVGITIDVSRRFYQHGKYSWWWREMDGVTIEVFPSRLDALDAERSAIASERPRHNIHLR